VRPCRRAGLQNPAWRARNRLLGSQPRSVEVLPELLANRKSEDPQPAETSLWPRSNRVCQKVPVDLCGAENTPLKWLLTGGLILCRNLQVVEPTRFLMAEMSTSTSAMLASMLSRVHDGTEHFYRARTLAGLSTQRLGERSRDEQSRDSLILLRAVLRWRRQ
jgi:hypothetical protein